MENDIIFKKANLGGFDREDVMNYISAITDEFHEKLSQKEKELAIVNTELEDVKAELAKVKAENADISERYGRLESENESLKLELKELADSKPDETDSPSEREQLKEMVMALTEKVNELISDASEKGTAAADDHSEYDRDLFDIIEQYVD